MSEILVALAASRYTKKIVVLSCDLAKKLSSTIMVGMWAVNGMDKFRLLGRATKKVIENSPCLMLVARGREI